MFALKKKTFLKYMWNVNHSLYSYWANFRIRFSFDGFVAFICIKSPKLYFCKNAFIKLFVIIPLNICLLKFING